MIDYGSVKIPRNRRRYTQPKAYEEGESRTPAQRDRDRILYTSAFRRLAEVTQVASPGHSQVFHNRLTHSLQVAQVGRSIAQKLQAGFRKEVDAIGGIDPDVVEAACLAHDIGHPPFGHTAEKVLRTRAGRAGFEGNAQSFRVVTKLAFKSEEYPGLDLTRATLAAILKYPWMKGQNPKYPDKWGAYQSEREDFRLARTVSPRERFKRTAEAELMNWADDVTYSVHDIEDFYRAGLIPMHLLARIRLDKKTKRFRLEGTEVRNFFDDVFARHAGERDFFKRDELEQAFAGVLWPNWSIDEPYSGTKDQRSKLRYFTAQLIHRYVNCVKVSRATKSISIDREFEKEVVALKELTWTYVIEAPALATQQEGQRTVINRLFDVYSAAARSKKKWGLFPHYYRQMLKKSRSRADRTRLVVDLIAGMTEPQAIATYRKFTGAWPSSSLEEVVR
jgi:dGTPase